MSWVICWVASGASPWVGSSKRRSVGAPARAIATSRARCCLKGALLSMGEHLRALSQLCLEPHLGNNLPRLVSDFPKIGDSLDKIHGA